MVRVVGFELARCSRRGCCLPFPRFVLLSAHLQVPMNSLHAHKWTGPIRTPLPAGLCCLTSGSRSRRGYDRRVEGLPEGPTSTSEPEMATRSAFGTVKTGLTWLVRLAIVVGFVVGVWESANHELGTIRSATSKQIVAHWDLDAAYWACLTSQVESL